MRTLAALAVVLAAIALLRALLSARGCLPHLGDRRLRVLEGLGLGARQRLVIVEVDGERLLLGVGEGPIQLLRELGPMPETISETALEPKASPPRALEGFPRRSAEAASVPAPAGASWRWRPALGAALRRALPLVVCGAGLGLASAAGAEPDAAGLGELVAAFDGATEPEGIASTLQVVALMTLVSVAPSILLMATCFTRVVIVLAFLRQAIGVQNLPPNQVLVGLALFVTMFVMAPVGERIHRESLDPYMSQEIAAPVALERAVNPIREYVVQFTSEDDLALFASFRGEPAVEDIADISLSTLLPSFLLSELRTAFEIGFMLYLPFLVIDLVIASLLISMGMIVLPPIVISLPFKLMLFVLLDGWNLVIGSLLTGLGGGFQ